MICWNFWGVQVYIDPTSMSV